VEAAYQKGVALELSGNNQGAQQQFETIFKKFPQSIFAGRSKIRFARTYRKEGKTPEAIAILTEVAASRTDESGAEAQFEIGNTYEMAREYQNAISAYLRVKYVFPSADHWIARSYLGLGECYRATNQLRKAKDAFEVVLKNHKDDELGREAAQKIKQLQES